MPLHRFVKLVSYHPGCQLEYIKFRMMHKEYHWDVTTIMFVIEDSVKLALFMQINGVCWSQESFLFF